MQVLIKQVSKLLKQSHPTILAHDCDNDNDEMFSTSSHDTKDKQIHLQCSATKFQDCSAFNQTEDNQSMDFSSLSNMSNQQQKYLHERYGHTLALNH
mmetsp:Transcript_24677/g.30347  ORF Transcript_24677/g.30347 Transcript_24677/m.30347 type:complete len:97 (+) Transcript_24677:109-399(+)